MKLKLWVSNQDVTGVQHDCTSDYLRVADATGVLSLHPGVSLNGVILSGDNPDLVWGAYRDLMRRVRDAGHGLDDESDVAAPALAAAVEDAEWPSRDLQHQVSPQPSCTSWGEFRREALLDGDDAPAAMSGGPELDGGRDN